MTEAESLLAMQECDLEIARAEKRLDELPEKRSILEVRAKEREIGALKAKAELLEHKLQAELKAHQDEISSLTDKLAGEQAKLMETNDHRQVQALTREMDGLKRRRDKIENESLALMERVEKATGQIAKVDEALAALAAKEAGLIAAFQDHGGEIQAEVANTRAKRDALAAHLPAELLERYETVRAAKGGVAVGRLSGDACTACRMELPAERVADLEAGPEIGTCPQCRRMIVVGPQE